MTKQNSKASKVKKADLSKASGGGRSYQDEFHMKEPKKQKSGGGGGGNNKGRESGLLGDL